MRCSLAGTRRVVAVVIFRRPAAEEPAAESDDAAAGVVDRDYDAPAKKIVDVAGIGVALHEPELLGILRIDAVERAHQRRWFTRWLWHLLHRPGQIGRAHV